MKRTHDKQPKLYQFRNCRLLRDSKIITDDLWVRDGKIIDPRIIFWGEQVKADVQIDCNDVIICPGFIDVQINGKYALNWGMLNLGKRQDPKSKVLLNLDSFYWWTPPLSGHICSCKVSLLSELDKGDSVVYKYTNCLVHTRRQFFTQLHSLLPSLKHQVPVVQMLDRAIQLLNNLGLEWYIRKTMSMSAC